MKPNNMPLSSHPEPLRLIVLLILTVSISPTQPYKPTDLILLNCGVSSGETSPDGRHWDGDEQSKFLASPSTTSSPLAASKTDPSLPQVPYMTARIFHSNFTYSFPVSSGPKFLRLYFYPTSYSDLDVSKSFFSLYANHYTLLSNFSASLAVFAVSPRPPVASFVKEYVITIRGEKLDVVFSPSRDSFAFINGIEIVSIPDGLYTKGYDYPLRYVGFDDYPFYLHETTALESVYRLNVGGGDVTGEGDTGMYRAWLQDSDYIFAAQFGVTPIPRVDVSINYTASTPAYTAPESVYRTYRSMGLFPGVNLRYNLTWNFSVDGGFTYLVRLHFCNTRMEVTKEGQEIFFIFINNQTAEEEADVIHWSGGNNVPVFKDYVSMVEDGRPSLLWLALHPNFNASTKYANAILNGIEIFKLNKSEGSLAGPNPEPQLVSVPFSPPPPESAREKRPPMVLVVVGAMFGGLFAVSLIVCFFVLKRRMKYFDKNYAKSSWMPFSSISKSIATSGSRLPSDLCRRFSIFEIEVATGKFDAESIIGSGGFGNVYKGYIDDGLTQVAIKRLHSSSNQGAREFKTEIKMLSKLRHLHLVALIGYCDDQGEMILVYEYMHHGTLRNHLYRTNNPPLPWKQRLNICIGAAKGLHYLHTGSKHMIIHRDVKSTNILLDENWVAKVSDFGLSRTGPTSVSGTHVSTVVKGSFGYVDPEYFRRQHLTEKSDVYSFGVVLFEVLCARPPTVPGLPKEQISLADWAKRCYKTGKLDEIIDPNLRDNIAPVCLKKFGEIAYRCVVDKGMERPTMCDVVWGLEFALQLQEAAEKNLSENYDIAISLHQENSLLVRPEDHQVAISDNDDLFSVSSTRKKSNSTSTISSTSGDGRNADQSPRLMSHYVFSELLDPRGR